MLTPVSTALSPFLAAASAPPSPPRPANQLPDVVEALERLLESDPRWMRAATRLDECDVHDHLARFIGATIAAFAADAQAKGQTEFIERARVWHAKLVQELANQRRLLVWAHERAAATGRTVPDLLNQWMLGLVDVVNDSVEADRKRDQLRRDLYGGDFEAEAQAWRDGTHPLHPSRRANA